MKKSTEKLTKKLSLFLAILTMLSILLSNIFVSAKCIENPYSQFVDDPYLETTTDVINGIRDRLVKLPGSGSVCVDFLAEEILLHRAALITSLSIQSYTKNPELIAVTEDILEDYSGELREMRIELAKLLDSFKDKEKFAEDSEYMKDYKVIIDKLLTSLSQTNVNDKPEATYIKQELAILEASNELAKNNDKYAKNNLVKDISKNIIENTNRDIARLKTLQTVFK